MEGELEGNTTFRVEYQRWVKLAYQPEIWPTWKALLCWAYFSFVKGPKRTVNGKTRKNHRAVAITTTK
jgi:hypothetical protein